jgi:Calcineurin-like phosphoesterase
MRDQVKDELEPIPDLTDDPVWTLAQVVGSERAAQIEAAGAVRFHAVGDSGAGKYPIDKGGGALHFGEVSPQVVNAQHAVAQAMNRDLNASLPGSSPAFFFHLGDVVYFDNTPAGFHEQFYEPYQDYGGKIIAIPGNHDAEVLLGHQPSTCYEFMKNFCPAGPTVPPDASPIIREMSAQPGVYWWLQTKFLDLVGLFSNSGEGPGFLRGRIPGEHQYDWFKDVLARIAHARQNGERKALVVATHHPPLTAKLFDSRDEGHSPSEEMSQDLDDAFNGADLWPDAILSAHVHNYQRFTRRVRGGQQVSYCIAGGGGRVPQGVLHGDGQQQGNVRFDRSHAGHGYLLVTAAPDQLHIEYHPVPGPDVTNRDDIAIPLL